MLERVDTGLNNSTDELIGPWDYKNSKNVIIHYLFPNQQGFESRNIRLQDLLKRGFPKCVVVKRFKWYSWLRFKYFANEISTLDNILSSEKLFLEVLDKVHAYYRKHINVEKCHEW